jgi:hypothetical protein
MQYRIILKNAWLNTWHNKYLWFFGLFAVFLGGINELYFVFSNLDNNMEKGLFSNWQSLAETGIFTPVWYVNFAQKMAEEPVYLIISLTILLLLLVVSLFLVWLANASQAAIVNNTALASSDKKHDFKQGLDAGIKKFLPVFGVNIVYKVIVYFLVLLISLPIIFLSSEEILGNILFFILFLIFIPVAISLSFIIKYSIAYIVIKNVNWIESLKKGFDLFKKNWLVSLEVSLILFTISFLVSFALLIAMMVVVAPFVFIFFMTTALAHFNFVLIFLTALTLLLILSAIVGSALTVYEISVWTVLFIELINGGGVSKIVRVFSKK